MIEITWEYDRRQDSFSGDCDIIMQMKAAELEPGLLKTFRLAMAVEFCLALLISAGEALDPEDSVRLISVFSLILSGFLLVYLFFGRLHRLLGKLYVPLALIVASVGPVIAKMIDNIFLFSAGNIESFSTGDSGTLLLWLLIPLLLISYQYRMWVMWLFTLGTAGLQMLLALILYLLYEYPPDFIIENLLIQILIYGIVGFVVARLSAGQRKQRLALAQKNEKLATYATMLEKFSVERERSRIAREMHDTLAHTLSAVSVQLGALEVLFDSDPSAARSTLQTTKEMSRQGLDEARRALQALRSSPLEELGFIDAVRKLAQKMADRTGLRLTLEMPDSSLNLPPETEQHLYRIIEESLVNVIRHADASSLTIVLKKKGNDLMLIITDNGVGMDPETKGDENRFGLRGIRERLQLINGTLEIESAPGSGTALTMIVKETV